MDIGFYIIILFLIMLKLMIWVCVFYSRAQRRRTLMANQARIISEGPIIIGQPGVVRDRDLIITNEHIPGYPGYSEGIVNQQFAPPSYDEVQRDKSMEQKPPTYEQVVTGSQFIPGNTATMPQTYQIPQSSVHAPGAPSTHQAQ